MADRLDSALRGLLIPDARLGVDGLAPNDGTATGSDYTEVGGRPGSSEASNPRSRVVAIVQGGLEREVEVEVVQAGDPGIDQRAARVRWRFAGDADVDWRGKVDPVWGSAWFPVEWTDTLGAALNRSFDVIVDKAGTERVLVVHREYGAVPRSIAKRSRGIDHFENAGTIAELTVGIPTILAGGDDTCVTQLPSGRVLAHDSGRVYYSDDVFTAAAPTWSLYSDTPFFGLLGVSGSPVPPNFAADRYRMHADRDGNVLMIQSDDYAAGNADGQVRVLLSTNLGATFEEVEFVDLGGGFPADVQITERDDGAILVSYLDFLQPRVRILASVFDKLSDAPEIEIEPAFILFTNLSVWADPRGLLWASVGTDAVQRIYRSEDGGETWEIDRWGWWSNFGLPVSYGPLGLQVVHARGFDWAIHSGDDGGSGFGNDNSIGCLRLGGWSNLEPAPDTTSITTNRPGPHQVGWLDVVGDTVDAICWIPFDTPDVGGNAWAQFGATAGVISAGATGEAMRINLAATDGGYEYPLADGVGPSIYCSTIPRSAGGAGSLTLLQHGVELVLTNGAGTVAAHVEIRILNTSAVGFRVRDVQAGVDLFDLAVAADFIDPWLVQTDPFLEFWILASGGDAAGSITLYYRRTDSEVWRPALLNQALAVGAIPLGGAAIRFGATDPTGTVDQLWRAFYFLESGEQDPRRWDTGREPLGGQVSDLPIALVGAGELDVSEALLSVRGGPAARNEVHTIAPIHDFPAAAVMWDAEPSRAVRWRDTGSGSVDRVFTWMFPEATRLDGSWILGLVVLDANFPVANLEVDLVGGGAGWTQVATLQLYAGLADLHYERHGDVIKPGTIDANTNDASRFINRGELVGGVARWGSPATGLGTARILANGGGGWADKSVNTIHPYLRVDPGQVAGSATVSDGLLVPPDDLRIQAPSGLVCAYLDEGQYIHGIRVVVPPASTPEGYREAGLIMPCAFSAFGQQWSRGYSLDTRPNVIRDESRQGTVRKREEGPPSTRVSMAWPDGVKLDAMRAGLEVNYLGPAGFPAVVADSDVWGQLRGILEETRSGEIPVVYVAELPPPAGGVGPTSITLTDRSLWGFGTLDGSARFDHVLGDEGINEYGRIAGIQVSEIR